MSASREHVPEIPCVGCGYDVRGLDAGGRCPECGAAIARSRAGERLANADPAWFRRVALGQRLAFLGLLVMILGVVTSLAVMFVGGLIALRADFDWEDSVGEIIRVVILAVGVFGGLVVASAGFFLVTSLDPRDTEREVSTSPRLRARWGLVAAIVLLGLGELDGFGLSPVMTTITTVLSFLGLAAPAVAVPALFLHLAALARRIPAPALAGEMSTLARRVRRQLWSLLVVVLARHATDLVPTGSPLSGVADGIETLTGCGLALLSLLLLLSLIATFGTMATLSGGLAQVRPEPSSATTRG